MTLFGDVGNTTPYGKIGNEVVKSAAMVLHPPVVPVNKCIANKIGSLSEKMMKAKVNTFLQSFP